jgi:hypothetical protein
MEQFTEQTTNHLSDSFSYYSDEFRLLLLEHLTYSVPSDEKVDVVRFLYFCAKEIKIHTMFTKAGISVISDTVFDNSSVRDFVLSLSDKYFITVSSSGMEKGETGISKLLDHIASGLRDYRVEREMNNSFAGLKGSLIPEKILNNIGVSEIRDIVEDNQWLITILLCNIVFPKIATIIGTV